MYMSVVDGGWEDLEVTLTLCVEGGFWNCTELYGVVDMGKERLGCGRMDGWR